MPSVLKSSSNKVSELTPEAINNKNNKINFFIFSSLPIYYLQRNQCFPRYLLEPQSCNSFRHVSGSNQFPHKIHYLIPLYHYNSYLIVFLQAAPGPLLTRKPCPHSV